MSRLFFYFFCLHGNIEDTGVGLEARTRKLNGSLKMGQSALIAANGTEWLINIMSLLISFTLRKKHSACICWFGSTDFTLRVEKKGFYLSCSWTWVLSTGPGKERASGSGSLFKWLLSAFVLRQRSAYPSKWSDLRRLRRATNLQPHPGLPDSVTRLQQCVEGVFLSFFFFLPSALLFCKFKLTFFGGFFLPFTLDDWRHPRLLFLPCVFAYTHR